MQFIGDLQFFFWVPVTPISVAQYKDLNQKLVSCTPPPAIDPVLSFRLLGACKLPHTQALEISEIFSSAPSTPVSHRDFRTCNTEALKIYFLQSVQHRSQSLGINTETKKIC
jgi:hypothetical protein